MAELIPHDAAGTASKCESDSSRHRRSEGGGEVGDPVESPVFVRQPRARTASRSSRRCAGRSQNILKWCGVPLGRSTSVQLRFTWLRKRRHDRVIGGGGDRLIPHQRNPHTVFDRTGGAAISARSKSPLNLIFPDQYCPSHGSPSPRHMNPWIQGMEFSGPAAAAVGSPDTDAENDSAAFKFSISESLAARLLVLL